MLSARRHTAYRFSVARMSLGPVTFGQGTESLELFLREVALDAEGQDFDAIQELLAHQLKRLRHTHKVRQRKAVDSAKNSFWSGCKKGWIELRTDR